MVYWILR